MEYITIIIVALCFWLGLHEIRGMLREYLRYRYATRKKR